MEIKDLKLAESFIGSGKYKESFDLSMRSLKSDPSDCSALAVMLRSLGKDGKLVKYEDLKLVLNGFINSRVKKGLDTLSAWPLISTLNKYIMKAHYEENNDFLKFLRNKKNIKRKKVKLLMLTCVWQRHDLTKVFYDYYKKIKNDIHDDIELEVLAVGSEGSVSKNMCEEYGFNYIEHPNQPLSDKWQAGASHAKNFDFDAMIIMGSDDFVSKDVFYLYKNLVESGIQFFGFQDLYLYNVKSQALGYWKGYGSAPKGKVQPARVGETIGLGRFLSSDLIEFLNFNLWADEHVNKSLDNLMQKRIIRKTGMLPVREENLFKYYNNDTVYSLGLASKSFLEEKLLVLDVKHTENVTNFEQYNVSKECYKSLDSEVIKKYEVYKKLALLGSARQSDTSAVEMVDKEQSSFYINNGEVALAQGKYIKAVIYFAQSIIEDAGNYEGKRLFLKTRELLKKNNEIETLIIIPVFNKSKTIERSIDSALEQSSGKKFVIAVDDCSQDDSIDLLNKYDAADNFGFLSLHKNSGPYYASNAALYVLKELNYKYFLVHGADDIMLKDKLKKQIKTITGDALISVSGYRRVDFNSGATISENRRGHSMAIYHKHIFDKLGFFYDTRFGGDSEYIHRAVHCYGESIQKNLPEILTTAYYGYNNITNANPDNSNMRLKFVEEYKKRHDVMKECDDYYIDFDLFGFDESLATKKRKKIVAGVAVIESRWSSFEKTVKSVIDQVDKLYVYQNGFKRIDEFLLDPKIEVISSVDTNIDRGDAGKFYMLGEIKNSYYFSIDDDLLYPEDYVCTTLKYLSALQDKCVVSYHGRVLKESASCYYSDIEENYRCLDDVTHLEQVEFAGTGVMAFDVENIKIGFDFFEQENMADIWMGIYCNKNDIPMYVLPHQSGWIKHNEIDFKDTIFNKYKKNKSHPNNVLKERYWSKNFKWKKKGSCITVNN
ncbi:glycosyltransferase family A protein [Halomonas sp. SpR1]|uniref:glycosyltransferase family 2 protein n=1 Tax=Halomonas sp. SpR1 TaxID=3050462 RepID=UPI0027E3F2B0|nr:glycosyltransferase family A protein [Halomonas sp. SpR1]MDQ7733400.1 glycosyltransferase family A protein [Halomonas sp. SpR1]